MQYDSETYRRIYKGYEKRANYTTKQICRTLIGTYTLIFAYAGFMIGLIASLIWRNVSYAYVIVTCAVGALLGLTVGICKKIRIYVPIKPLIEIEKKEGYSDNLMDYVIKTYNTGNSEKNQTSWVTAHAKISVAIYHNIRGEYEQAQKLISECNMEASRGNPSVVEYYCIAALETYSMLGNMKLAENTVMNAQYYFTVKANSPTTGSHIARSMGIYEYAIGNYPAALDCFRRSLDLDARYPKPEELNSVGSEQIKTDIIYRMALAYSAMGNSAAAIDLLEKTNGRSAVQCTRNKIDLLYSEISFTAAQKN